MALCTYGGLATFLIYEPGVHADFPALANVGHAVAVLSAGHPLRSGSCAGDSRVPLYRRRTHAGKARPHQGQIWAGGAAGMMFTNGFSGLLTGIYWFIHI